MTNFNSDNSNSTLWTADVITGNFLYIYIYIKKKKKNTTSFFYYKYDQNKLFLTSGWPGQTSHHKIQYGYDLRFNTGY